MEKAKYTRVILQNDADEVIAILVRTKVLDMTITAHLRYGWKQIGNQPLVSEETLNHFLEEIENGGALIGPTGNMGVYSKARRGQPEIIAGWRVTESTRDEILRRTDMVGSDMVILGRGLLDETVVHQYVVIKATTPNKQRIDVLARKDNIAEFLGILNDIFCYREISISETNDDVLHFHNSGCDAGLGFITNGYGFVGIIHEGVIPGGWVPDQYNPYNAYVWMTAQTDSASERMNTTGPSSQEPKKGADQAYEDALVELLHINVTDPRSCSLKDTMNVSVLLEQLGIPLTTEQKVVLFDHFSKGMKND